MSTIKLITLLKASNQTYLPDLFPLEHGACNNSTQFDASNVRAPYFAGSDTTFGSPGSRKGGLSRGPQDRVAAIHSMAKSTSVPEIGESRVGGARQIVERGQSARRPQLSPVNMAVSL